MKSIGIDIGGTKIKVGLVYKGIITKYLEINNTFKGNCEEMVDNIITSIKQLISINDISFIGIGIPGGVRDGMVYGAVHLGIESFPLENYFTEKSGIKTKIENDATVALIGEFLYGSLKGTENGILMTLGTGIGGGFVINGRVYRGSHLEAGEFGHAVYKRDGHPCPCGKLGCYEQYASAEALFRITKDRLRKNKKTKLWDYCNGDINNLNGRVFFKAIEDKDEMASEILEEYTFYIADGLCDLLNILDVERVAIGGGISGAGEVLIKPIRDKVLKRNFDVEIVKASLENKAGVIGASSLERVG